MMDVAVKVFLLCCLFEGSRCQNWATIMPTSVEGLVGSCVKIPCRFTMPRQLEADLDDTCRAIWRKGYYRTEVFDSSRTGGGTDPDLLQGNLTGNLKDRDCTTILHNVMSDHNDYYYFRLECDNYIKFNFFDNSVTLDIKDSPPRPKILADNGDIMEGDTLTLRCRAPAHCPLLPPALTWTPQLADAQETLEGSVVTSVMALTATYLHNAAEVSCTARYRRQDGRLDDTQKSLTLRVGYAPKNTSVSYMSPATEGTILLLTCNTDANPTVDSYTWYQVDGGQVTPVGSRKRLYITVTEASNSFYCRVHNRYGYQNSSRTLIEVQFPPKETSVIVEPDGPIVEGDTVVLLCQSRAKPPVSDHAWLKNGNRIYNETDGVLFLERVEERDGGLYRCRAINQLGEDLSDAVQLDVEYAPRNTLVAVYPSSPVPDGNTVTLRCTSVANPAVANFTWYRVAAGEREVIGQGEAISFKVKKLSQEDFYCQTVNVHGLDVSETLNINVTFRPEILASSHCEDVSSQTRCSCDSRANPTPLLYWELSGVPVNHSSITEMALGGGAMTSVVTFQLPDQDTFLLVCYSVNPLGLDSVAFNMSSPRIENGRSSLGVLVGSTVAVLAMLFLSLLLFLYIRRKTKGNFPANQGRAENTARFPVTNESNSGYVNATYTNNVAKEESPAEEDQLHYADVKLAKLEAMSDDEPEIRGLASMTGEYAEIRLRPKGSDGGGGEEAGHRTGEEEDGAASEEVLF